MVCHIEPESKSPNTTAMGIDLNGVKGLVGAAWSVPAKPCDSCKTASATVFCSPDSAFLCLSCDARIHSANKLATRHKRVWLCDVCEQAPAAVTCKADAAALCVSCDADIHSANPLAQRHERFPVEPFFDSADSLVKSSAFNFAAESYSHHCSDDASGGASHHYDEVDTGSLLLPNPNDNSASTFFTEMDDSFIDFAYPKSVDSKIRHHDCDGASTDSVVPVQTKPPVINHYSSEINCYKMDFIRSKLSSFTYPSHSITQNVSSSSLDVGVVPDGNSNAISDTSYPLGRNMGSEAGSIIGAVTSGAGATVATGPAQATQLSGIDREARVMRYREKRKNRKFEKTIRYASRKAYAETRPRIKGRFAKRNETGTEPEGLFSSALYMGDCEYGVVPSF